MVGQHHGCVERHHRRVPPPVHVRKAVAYRLRQLPDGREESQMARLGRQFGEPFVEVPLEIARYGFAGDDRWNVFDPTMMPCRVAVGRATPDTSARSERRDGARLVMARARR
jgi:hypothetical protein